MTPGYICQIRSTRDAMSPALSVFRHACACQHSHITDTINWAPLDPARAPHDDQQSVLASVERLAGSQTLQVSTHRPGASEACMAEPCTAEDCPWLTAHLCRDADRCQFKGFGNYVTRRVVGKPPADRPCDPQGVGGKQWDGHIENDGCDQASSKSSQKAHLHKLRHTVTTVME